MSEWKLSPDQNVFIPLGGCCWRRETVVSEPRQTRTIAATNIAMWFSHRARELTSRIQGQLPAPIISLQNGFHHSFIILLIVNLYRYAIALSDYIHRIPYNKSTQDLVLLPNILTVCLVGWRHSKLADTHPRGSWFYDFVFHTTGWDSADAKKDFMLGEKDFFGFYSKLEY